MLFDTLSCSEMPVYAGTTTNVLIILKLLIYLDITYLQSVKYHKKTCSAFVSQQWEYRVDKRSMRGLTHHSWGRTRAPRPPVWPPGCRGPPGSLGRTWPWGTGCPCIGEPCPHPSCSRSASASPASIEGFRGALLTPCSWCAVAFFLRL